MSGKLPSYRYRISVVRVIDGDTIVVDVDLGFYTTTRIHLRLLGINCPEMNTPEGKSAKAATEDWIINNRTGVTLVADTFKVDKYGGRWDAIVWGGDVSLNDTLVVSGHAVRKEYK